MRRRNRCILSRSVVALSILTAATSAGAGETAVDWQVDTHG